MTVSKGKVISDKDLEILLDRTDLLGEKMFCFTVFKGGNRVWIPSVIISLWSCKNGLTRDKLL